MDDRPPILGYRRVAPRRREHWAWLVCRALMAGVVACEVILGVILITTLVANAAGLAQWRLFLALLFGATACAGGVAGVWMWRRTRGP